MLEFGSGNSGVVNSKQAVAECLEIALGTDRADCSLLVLCTSMGHNFRDILSEAHRLAPHAAVVGTTCAGVIGGDGPNESMRALAAMTVRGPKTCLTVTGLESLLEIDYYEAGVSIARNLAAANPRLSFVLLYFSPFEYARGPVDDTIRGIESVLGPDVPIIGGLSMDNSKIVTCFQFLGNQVFERGAVAVGFSDPDIEVVCGSNHGFTVLGKPLVATKTDRNHVYELDGSPAWVSLCNRLGLPEQAHPMSLFPYAGLAEELPEDLRTVYGSQYIGRFAAALTDESRGIYCYHNIERGTRLWLLKRDESQIVEGIAHLTRQILSKLDGRRPLAVFHADCLLRGRLLFNRIVKEETVALLQVPICGDTDVPWLGMYSGGEFGPLEGHNTVHIFTSTLAVVAERRR